MKKIIISLLLLTIILPSLTACAYFHDGKISQDKLPWKKSGEVLQEVDFTRRTLNWEEVNNVYELKRSSDQGYFMSVFPKNGRSISTSSLVFSDTKFSVEAKKVTGSDETSYGLVCRYQDKQNFYGFSVSTDGYAGIYRVEDGKTSLLSGENYLYTELIEMHDGVNMIVAICQNESLRLEINGVEVLRATDDRFQIGEVGFFLETAQEGNASALFNHFIVVKP